MPFTTAHPAVVLPLKKLAPGWFSLSGLIAGAMSPDLLYFLFLDTHERGMSHSWTGLFTFCLPVGLVFVLAFHLLVKKPLVAHLPGFVGKYLWEFASRPFPFSTTRSWLILIWSVIVGTLSHFAWDSFTHYNGEIAQFLPPLNEPVTMMGITRPISRWLQHLSSLFGQLFVLVYLPLSGLLPLSAPPADRPGTMRRSIYWLSALLIGTAAGYAAITWMDNLASVRATFGLAAWASFFYFNASLTIVDQVLKIFSSPKMSARKM